MDPSFVPLRLNVLNLLRRYPLTSFFVLAYAWTWLCWWSVFAASSGRMALPMPSEWLAICGQFGPFAAAMILTWVASGRDGFGEFFARLVQWRSHPIWLAVSFLLLPATMLIAILLFASADGSVATLRFRD